MKKYDAVIIGGGMSGMVAAVLLADQGKSVCILERQERLGKKILLTGNGKCNLTNKYVSNVDYICDDVDKLKKILGNVDYEKEMKFWGDMGLYLKEKNGYVYPVSNQAATVPDILKLALNKRNVDICLDYMVSSVDKNDKGFVIKGKQDVLAENVYLCCGGMAGVYKEAANNGYGLAKKLGHKIMPCYPGLTQTVCEGNDKYWKEVSGVRTDAKVSLYVNDKLISEDTGELQLTDKGLSGIPVFQLSRYMGIALNNKDLVQIETDYMPFISKESLEKDVRERLRISGDLDAEQTFIGMLNKKLLVHILKKSGISPTRPFNTMPEDKKDKCIKAFVNNIKKGREKVLSLNDFSHAQISTGGVPLSEVDDNMQSLKTKGVYILGEMLDVPGKCGGYNLHFAVATAFASCQ